MEFFIVAPLFLEIPNPVQRMGEPYSHRILYARISCNLHVEQQNALKGIEIPQLRFGITDDASSFPTESSTPLMNWTDSGAENLRAISSASLITTGRGV